MTATDLVPIAQIAGPVCTAVAAGAAIWLGLRQGRWRKQDRRNDARAEATCVVVRPALSVGRSVEYLERVYVWNAGKTPMLRVRFRFYDLGGVVYDSREAEHDAIGPYLFRAVIAPGETHEKEVNSLKLRKYFQGEVDKSDLTIKVSWDDPLGFRWEHTSRNGSHWLTLLQGEKKFRDLRPIE